jgi:hypothetical protein
MIRATFWKKVSSWTNLVRSGSSRPRATFRPCVEGLENRTVPSGFASGSISGSVFQDVTGNGLSADDTALKGVTVKLYLDHNHDGIFDHHGRLVAEQRSAADGSYAFNNLPAGQYFVKEERPWGFVRTAPTNSESYTVTLGAGQASTGQNFDNFQRLDHDVVRKISYTVISPGGSQTTVPNLRGQTQAGDTVVVNFTIAPWAGPTTVSLVSYNAPGATFDPNTASQQTIFQDASATFGPGQHSLSVTLPNGFYQVDFVLGQAINPFGPAGSNIFYSAQDRLYSADNGGTAAPAPATLSGTVYTDIDFSNSLTPEDLVVPGAKVTLTGTTTTNQSVSLTATTDHNGLFTFSGLLPGTYTLSFTVVDMGDMAETPNIGSLGSPAAAAVAGQVETISNIVVAAGATGTNYNFGQLTQPPNS